MCPIITSPHECLFILNRCNWRSDFMTLLWTEIPLGLLSPPPVWEEAGSIFLDFPHQCESSSVHRKQQVLKGMSGMAAVSFSSEHSKVFHPQRGMESTLGKLVRAGREGSKRRVIIDGFLCLFLFWPGSQEIRSQPTCAYQRTSRGFPRKEIRKNRREAPGRLQGRETCLPCDKI